MKKKWYPFLAILMAFSLLVTACGGGGGTDSSPAPQQDGGEEQAIDTSNITIGAATIGGFWYVLSGALGDEMKKQMGTNVTVIEGGSIANIQGIVNGQFQIGFTNGQNLIEALQGFGGFSEPMSGFSAVASLYPNVMHLVVREDSDIHSVEDLKGKRVSPGIKGYGGEIAFQQILEAYGMSYDDLAKVEYVGTDDGVNLLRDGQLDALALLLVTPVPAVQELQASLGVRLLPLSDEAIAKLREINEGYYEFTITKDTYGMNEDVKTVAAETIALVDDDLPEDFVYNFTKILVENRDRWESMNAGMKDFDAEYAVSRIPGGLPFHPGAEKYYKEIGVLE